MAKRGTIMRRRGMIVLALVVSIVLVTLSNSDRDETVMFCSTKVVPARTNSEEKRLLITSGGDFVVEDADLFGELKGRTGETLIITYDGWWEKTVQAFKPAPKSAALPEGSCPTR